MIDRSNYEIWFTEWLDNTLSEEQVVELNRFLDANPDLKEEFESMSTFHLQPAAGAHVSKGRLKKSPGEINPYQFELLCAAFTENDLDGSGLAEFKMMLEGDVARQKTLEVFRRTKLIPPEVHYPNTRILKHRVAGKRTILYVLSSAAAAIVAIMALAGLFNQKTSLPLITGNLADTIYITRNTPGFYRTVPVTRSQTARLTDTAGKKIITQEYVIPDTEVVAEKKPGPTPATTDHLIPDQLTISPVNEIAFTTLQAVNIDSYEYRSGLGRLVAMTFREKVLNRDDYDDTPLKAYEIAEAGITGLNKLLGWEMDLTANNDENGDLKSLNFTSRTIRFSTPVRKNESRE